MDSKQTYFVRANEYQQRYQKPQCRAEPVWELWQLNLWPFQILTLINSVDIGQNNCNCLGLNGEPPGPEMLHPNSAAR